MKSKLFKHLIFILVFLFAMPIAVHAERITQLDMKNVTLTCIYSDGSIFSFNYDITVDDSYTYRMTRDNYNLKGSIENSASAKSNDTILFQERDYQIQTHALDAIGTGWIVTCKPFVTKLVYDVKDGDNHSITDFYGFTDDNNKKFNVEDLGIDKYTTGWYWYWNENTESVKKAVNEQKSYELISENYVISSQQDETEESVYFVRKSSQTAGNDSYIEFSVYSNAVLVTVGDRTTLVRENNDRTKALIVDSTDTLLNKITEVDGNGDRNIYLNMPEAIASVSGSKIAYEYRKNQIYYTTSKTSNNINSVEYKYAGEDGTKFNQENDALCTEIMPNTSATLRTIIKYTQILIPIIIIIYTAFDIGKIVVSGNLEDELPKKKKIIVIRLIVAVFFFFLPLLLQIFITILNTIGLTGKDTANLAISYIKCLF